MYHVGVPSRNSLACATLLHCDSLVYHPTCRYYCAETNLSAVNLTSFTIRLADLLPVGRTRNQATTVMYRYVQDCKLMRFMLFMMDIKKCHLALILRETQEILSIVLQIIVSNMRSINSELLAFLCHIECFYMTSRRPY